MIFHQYLKAINQLSLDVDIFVVMTSGVNSTVLKRGDVNTVLTSLPHIDYISVFSIGYVSSVSLTNHSINKKRSIGLFIME